MRWPPRRSGSGSPPEGSFRPFPFPNSPCNLRCCEFRPAFLPRLPSQFENKFCTTSRISIHSEGTFKSFDHFLPRSEHLHSFGGPICLAACFARLGMGPLLLLPQEQSRFLPAQPKGPLDRRKAPAPRPTGSEGNGRTSRIRAVRPRVKAG
jgi:hypothetical protein